MARADLTKKKKKTQNKQMCMNFYYFIYNFSVALISALALLKSDNLRPTVVF